MSDPSEEELEALAAKRRAAFGRYAGEIWMADDFDAPMELVDASPSSAKNAKNAKDAKGEGESEGGCAPGPEQERAEPDARADEVARVVIGAAIEVHRALGPGFAEATYEEALCIELHERGVAFERQAPVRVEYKGHVVGEGRLDLLVERLVVVELKATETLAPVHFSQVISYLRATGLPLGLLITFNVRLLSQGVHRVLPPR